MEQNAKGPDESRWFGGEVGYPRAEIQRTGKNVDIVIAGNGITYPFKTIEEARKTYLLLEMLGNRLCPEEPKETRKCKHCGKEGFVSQEGKTWVCYEHAEIPPKEPQQPKQDSQPSLEEIMALISSEYPIRADEKLRTLAQRINSLFTARLESLREELKITPDESRSEDTKDVFIEFNSHIDRVFDRAIDKEKNGEL